MASTIYSFRRAGAPDLDSIVHAQIAMAWETEALHLEGAVCTKGVQAVLDDAARGVYYVAERASHVVGVTLTTYEWSDWRNGVVWWIQSVYVLPEFRKQGVYSGIYGHIRTLAEADPQVRGIRLYVDRRNTAAQQVYSQLGMDGDHYRVFEWMK